MRVKWHHSVQNVMTVYAVVPKSKIDPDWAILGYIGLNKMQWPVLNSFQLDCHHQVDLYLKLGNWWLLSKVGNKYK